MVTPTPTAADSLCLLGAAAFFLVGLLTGVWKYACIARDPAGRAPVYVDTAHRTSLLYAFACALLGQLCQRSAFSDRLNRAAALVLMAFFAATVAGYVVHGILRDTDNQLRRPHRLGARTLPPGVMTAFMSLLIAAEVGGFLVLCAGLVVGLFGR
jgi:hypothetical protein